MSALYLSFSADRDSLFSATWFVRCSPFHCSLLTLSVTSLFRVLQSCAASVASVLLLPRLPCRLPNTVHLNARAHTLELRPKQGLTEPVSRFPLRPLSPRGPLRPLSPRGPMRPLWPLPWIPRTPTPQAAEPSTFRYRAPLPCLLIIEQSSPHTLSIPKPKHVVFPFPTERRTHTLTHSHIFMRDHPRPRLQCGAL